MAPHFDSLCKIQPPREAWRLKVRVTRLWTVPSYNNLLLSSSLEMVLMDEFGTKIQASIRKNLIAKYKPQLVEGNVYRMAYFTVIPNLGSYRASRHSYRLIFTFRTTVEQTSSQIIPTYGLTFTPFSEILSSNGESDYLIDVIGIVSTVGNEKQYEREGKITKVIVIELADERGDKLELALFGDFVDQFLEYVATTDENNLVIVVQFVKVKTFRGKTVIQNVMHASKLFLNPNFADAIEFRNRFADHEVQEEETVAELGGAQLISIEDDFMRLNPKKSIKELVAIDKAGHYILMATVKSIIKDAKWWYPSCKCNRSLTIESEAFYCDMCFSHSFSVFPRYLLKIGVEDESAVTTLLLFDRDCEYLFKKSCLKLLGEFEEETGNIVGYPSLFEDIVGKKFLFKVEVKLRDAQDLAGPFPVRRVTDDETLISMFYMTMDDITPIKDTFSTPFPEIYNLGNDEDESVAGDAKLIEDSQCYEEAIGGASAAQSIEDSQCDEENPVGSASCVFHAKRKFVIDDGEEETPVMSALVKAAKP